MSQKQFRPDPSRKYSLDLGWIPVALPSRLKVDDRPAPLTGWLRRMPNTPPSARRGSRFRIEHLEIRTVPSGMGFLSPTLASILPPSLGLVADVVPEVATTGAGLVDRLGQALNLTGSSVDTVGNAAPVSDSGLSATLGNVLNSADRMITGVSQDVSGVSKDLGAVVGNVVNAASNTITPVAQALDTVLTGVGSGNVDLPNVVGNILTPVDQLITTTGTGVVSTVGDVAGLIDGTGTGDTSGAGTPSNPTSPTSPTTPGSPGDGPATPPSQTQTGSNPTPPSTGGQITTAVPTGPTGGETGKQGPPTLTLNGGGSTPTSGPIAGSQSAASLPIAIPVTIETAPTGGSNLGSGTESGSNLPSSDASLQPNPGRLNDEASSGAITEGFSEFNPPANDAQSSGSGSGQGGTLGSIAANATQAATGPNSAPSQIASGSNQPGRPGQQVVASPGRSPVDRGEQGQTSPEIMPQAIEDPAFAELLQGDLANLERSLEELIHRLGETGYGLAQQLNRFGIVEFLVGAGLAIVACEVIRRWERRRSAMDRPVIVGSPGRPVPFNLPKGWKARPGLRMG